MCGGVHGRGGYAWQGVHVEEGGMCSGDEHGGGHAWQGVHDREGTCVAGGCVGGVHATHAPLPRQYEIRSVNARAVRILPECILVEISVVFAAVHFA